MCVLALFVRVLMRSLLLKFRGIKNEKINVVFDVIFS
jgi:hypothetical protein